MSGLISISVALNSQICWFFSSGHGPMVHRTMPLFLLQGDSHARGLEDVHGLDQCLVGGGSDWIRLPSGKRLHNYGKSPFSMGKSTINGHFQ